LKVKIFLWLVFRRRHWTNDRRARHGLEAKEECYLCDQASKTIDHILCSCPYAREVWFHICRALGRPLPTMAGSLCLVEAGARRVAGPSEERHGLSFRANLLANLEGEECPLLHGSLDIGT
jgi:hypothetical protein